MSKHKWLFIFILLVVLTSGCVSQATLSTTSMATDAGNYSGALHTEYADALDVAGQLALGVLRLEDTSNVVTEAQASNLLTLWQVVQGSVLKSESERDAVGLQIEYTLTPAQLTAIAELRLTQADAQTWLQEHGIAEGMSGGAQQAGGQRPSGGAGSKEVRPEVPQALRDQFAAPGGAATGVSVALNQAVMLLLTERRGQAMVITPAVQREQETSTAQPKLTASPTPRPTVTVMPKPTFPATPTPVSTDSAITVLPTSLEPTDSIPAPVAALTHIPDTDPGPPLIVEVTTNYAVPNSYVEEGLVYKVAGLVHNPTDQTYAVTALHVTFYDADGFRGAFYPFPNARGRERSGEYIWHGAMEADVACAVLGPGEVCPFSAEIAAQNMASFRVHPDAVVADFHTSVAVTLHNVQVADDGGGYVVIRGHVMNPHVFAVKNVAISGVLLDGSGQMVSMGTTIVVDILPESAVDFTLYIERQAYISYHLYVQAEQGGP